MFINAYLCYMCTHGTYIHVYVCCALLWIPISLSLYIHIMIVTYVCMIQYTSYLPIISNCICYTSMQVHTMMAFPPTF